MKYDISLDPADANTSHVQVLDLVGTGKRVLDVGCSTGYLAAALKERDNVVTGVELDPKAGELARPHLEQLVIGDLESMDLVAELGAHRFDVIVFADVLEHLTDPLAVLRQAPGLLVPGGSVVISIPNVAHGAVRLALLQGQFEYRDLGLLDSTHLRFFTRSTVDDLHRQAGLVPVEQRRTTAEPFDTEIRLREADFSAELVERLKQDPDATTYQFVIRSVAAGDAGAGAASAEAVAGDPGAELVARNQEIEELRAQLRRVSEVSARVAPPTVAVVRHGDAGGSLDELRAAVVVRELARRLPGWSAAHFDWSASEPRPAADGTPVRPFVVDGGPQERTGASVDAAVLAGTWPASAVAEVTVGAGEDGCAVHLAGVVGPGLDELPQLRPPSSVAGWADDRPRSFVADLLLLATRTWSPPVVAMRAQYLAATGALPDRPYALVAVASGQPAALGRALDLLTAELDVNLAAVSDPARDPGGTFAKAVAAEVTRPTVVATDLAPLDLLAAVTAARLVVTDDPGLLWLALGAGRPFVGVDVGSTAGLTELAGWLGDPDVAVTSPAAIGPAVALADRRAAAPVTETAAADLELFFDELADAVGGRLSGQRLASLPAQLAEMTRRADTLEAVNRGLRHRLFKQHTGFADVARRALHGSEGAGINPVEHHRVLQQLAAAEAEVARMQAEVAELVLRIQATESTITMRTLRPARRLYGRLRRL